MDRSNIGHGIFRPLHRSMIFEWIHIVCTHNIVRLILESDNTYMASHMVHEGASCHNFGINPARLIAIYVESYD